MVKKFQLRSKEKFSLANSLKAGEEMVGTVLEIKEVEETDEEGEVKIKKEYYFKKDESNEELAFLGNSGFNFAFESSGAKIGDLLKIVKKGKKEFGTEGRSVNQFDIYIAE